MRKFKKILGIMILSCVFIGLFIGTMIDSSFIKALILWGISIGLTGIVIFAVYLIFNDK
jgi:hypothetical protein